MTKWTDRVYSGCHSLQTPWVVVLELSTLRALACVRYVQFSALHALRSFKLSASLSVGIALVNQVFPLQLIKLNSQGYPIHTYCFSTDHRS